MELSGVGKEAVVLIGIQATGKSTFFGERFCGTHVRKLVEGFDQLSYVRIQEDGTFLVEEWRDEI